MRALATCVRFQKKFLVFIFVLSPYVSKSGEAARYLP